MPDIEKGADIDYVDVSAGVHHSFIHTPMEFEGGWERGYARQIREVSNKPVLAVGRITTPDLAESLLEAGDADAICLARQLFTDPYWAKKAEEGHADDIARQHHAPTAAATHDILEGGRDRPATQHTPCDCHERAGANGEQW